MSTMCGNEHITGPFDDCLHCQYLGNGCSGPRTTCMTHERYITWLKALKKLRGYTNQEIADGTGLSLGSVNDIFAGRRKDISRTSAGLLEDFLVGGGAKWPCAMTLASGKDVVYEDRAETLEALRVRTEQVDNLRRNYEDLKRSVDAELQRVRDEHRDDLVTLRERIAWLVEQSRMKDEQLARKDDYIDRLAKKVGL